MSIRSFAGVVSYAFHCMGEMTWRDDEGSEHKVELSFVMDEHAARKNSNPDFKARVGDHSSRFLRKEDLIEAARICFTRLAPEEDTLVIGGDRLNPGDLVVGANADVLQPLCDALEAEWQAHGDGSQEYRAILDEWQDKINDLYVNPPYRSDWKDSFDERDARQSYAYVHQVDGVWQWIDEADLPDPYGYRAEAHGHLVKPDDL